MKDWRDNVTFVLVEPRESGNIGASARAMKNMGFAHLDLVRPPDRLSDEAMWFARNALDVLQGATHFSTLREATQDKALVVGTTRRTGKRRGMILPVEEGAKKIMTVARANRVAVLFGREDRGLYNEEVEECGFLLTIPTSRGQRSLNLAQAVLIVGYELAKAGYREEGDGQEETPSRRSEPFPVLVSHEDLNTLFERIARVIDILGYLPRGDRDLERKILVNLKYFIGRAGLTKWELGMLLGLLSQVEKRINEGIDRRPQE